MRVTEKGQVTIPKPVRDRLGIVPGSEVDFIEDADGNFELVRLAGDAAHNAEVARLAHWIEKVRGTGKSGMSTDDVMRETRGRKIGDPR